MYDAVLIATPLEFTDLALALETVPTDAQRRRFQTTHATFVTGSPNKKYFGLSPKGTVTQGSGLGAVIIGLDSDASRTSIRVYRIASFPDTITTMEVAADGSSPPFSSIGFQGFDTSLNHSSTFNTVYKLFSRERLSDSLLQTLFAPVRSVRRVQWDAYPVLTPRY